MYLLIERSKQVGVVCVDLDSTLNTTKITLLFIHPLYHNPGISFVVLFLFLFFFQDLSLIVTLCYKKRHDNCWIPVIYLCWPGSFTCKYEAYFLKPSETKPKAHVGVACVNLDPTLNITQTPLLFIHPSHISGTYCVTWHPSLILSLSESKSTNKIPVLAGSVCMQSWAVSTVDALFILAQPTVVSPFIARLGGSS